MDDHIAADPASESPANDSSMRETTPRETTASDDRGNRRIFLMCLVAAIVVTVVVTFRKDIKYRFVVKNWGTVVPDRIYRSGQISKWLIEDQLTRHDIDLVIDMQTLNPSDPHQQYEIETAKRLEIELLRCPLGGDGTGDVQSYIDALQALQMNYDAGKNILLHCHAGADRTGGIFYCYRTLIQGQSPEEALAEMQRYGWYPHAGNPLIAYLHEHLPTIAEQLAARGVIESVPDPLPRLPVD